MATQDPSRTPSDAPGAEDDRMNHGGTDDASEGMEDDEGDAADRADAVDRDGLDDVERAPGVRDLGEGTDPGPVW